MLISINVCTTRRASWGGASGSGWWERFIVENGLVGQHQYQHHCFVTFQNMNQDRLAGKYVINLLKAALAQFPTAGSLQNIDEEE